MVLDPLDPCLQVSKALVEMQIENNKIKEEAEQMKFELTNKVSKYANMMLWLGRRLLNKQMDVLPL